MNLKTTLLIIAAAISPSLAFPDSQSLPINPTPHHIRKMLGNNLNVMEGFKINDHKNVIANSHIALKKNSKGVPLKIVCGNKYFTKGSEEDRPGAYILSISPEGIDIKGYDEAGAFYALQTLRQLLSIYPQELPLLTIKDYPALGYRGLVEGFYGTPWSHATRLSLIDFLGRNKMNSYVYGPKDDPYHRSPNWREPYPEKEGAQIRELAQACKRNHVDFVWAIHPGQDIKWDADDYKALLDKFEAMYALGVRQFAIFFDDISGIGTDSHMQADWLNRLTRDFVKRKKDVGNLIICPTDYNMSWANPTENGQLAIYGRDLTPGAQVFWTGSVVCGDINKECLDFVDSRIKRPALVWWNYPVTDYCRHRLLQGPVYGLESTLTPQELSGIESNPMEHGEASKLALFGVADWAWNPAAFAPLDNWERGIADIMPDAADTYRTFAIHSADAKEGYRRDESWETEIFDFDNYTPAQYNNLMSTFMKVEAAPAKIFKSENHPLVEELRPWLLEFEKLGRRGQNTLKLIKTFEAGSLADFWSQLPDADMTPQQRADYEAHISGSLKLQPFCDNAINAMRRAFYKKLTGHEAATPTIIGTFANLQSMEPRKMLDNDSTTFYHSFASQAPDSWIGVDFGKVKMVDIIDILQGRREDDTDVLDTALLETSFDGLTWTQLGDTIKDTIHILWKGEPVEARYVRLRRAPESTRTHWLALRTFKIAEPTLANSGLAFSGAAESDVALFDGNPETSTILAGSPIFSRRPHAHRIAILGARDGSIELSQLDASGSLLQTLTISSPFAEVELLDETVNMQIKGNKQLFELPQY